MKTIFVYCFRCVLSVSKNNRARCISCTFVGESQTVSELWKGFEANWWTSHLLAEVSYIFWICHNPSCGLLVKIYCRSMKTEKQDLVALGKPWKWNLCRNDDGDYKTWEVSVYGLNLNFKLGQSIILQYYFSSVPHINVMISSNCAVEMRSSSCYNSILFKLLWDGIASA